MENTSASVKKEKVGEVKLILDDLVLQTDEN